ncbi:MAG TPA: 5-oxoprolinase subunit PxpA [Longimicrobiaceae bacterium]|nr:5-oxoprolinase subunit PxpA [Longimicrobiaceae bacterium]
MAPERNSIDLNADLGESFGAWRAGDDDAVLAVVTSANVACGFHAGDPVVMRRTVAAAADRGVSIGAHPGYPDLMGFGRREMAASPDEVTAYVMYQVGALHAFCTAAGVRLRYVKAHGALYNRAGRDPATAAALAEGVRLVDPTLALLALAGSEMVRAGQASGLRVAAEAFVDRAYLPTGDLVPRSQPGATLHDVDVVSARAVRMAREGTVEAIDGTVIHVAPDSLCVHGDNPDAAAIVRAVRDRLRAEGIAVAPFA